MASDALQHETGQPYPIAVFDYDGTCINGQSGSLVATWLLRRGYLSPRAVVGLAWWGICYKLHLPHRQERARELIFGDLGKLPSEDVDRILVEFHDEVLLKRYRKQAIAEIERRKQEGCITLLVSATFEVIAREAAKTLGVDGFAATKMERDSEGRYTGNVLGDVTAGKPKVNTVTSLATTCAHNNPWYLAYAYGDHHSDEELLSAAKHPFVVSPGPTLKRMAHRKGWPIIDWR